MTLPTLKVTVDYELDRQMLARALAMEWSERGATRFPDTRAEAIDWARSSAFAACSFVYLGEFGMVEEAAADVLHLALLTVNQLFPELRP